MKGHRAYFCVATSARCRGDLLSQQVQVDPGTVAYVRIQALGGILDHMASEVSQVLWILLLNH